MFTLPQSARRGWGFAICLALGMACDHATEPGGPERLPSALAFDCERTGNRDIFILWPDVFVPQYGTNDVDGSWIIENYGVDPDIEVENTPKSVIEGRDLQLERAIAEIMQAVERDPRRLPERPADPVKTR
jgi:hypothetical protein